MTFQADLHCHSTLSDGSYTPQELIELAVEKGLSGLSITDHDTFEAYPSSFALAEAHGIRLLTGVEFSTQFETESVHVLAYRFDYTHADLKAFSLRHKQRRQDRNLQILAKLKNEGILIEPEELLKSPSTTIGRPHIARLMIEKGYVPDILTAFKSYLGDKKKCHVPGIFPSLEETLEIIHAAKGLAVLAHPHLYRNRQLVRKILTHPLDGLECYYARMSAKQNAPWISLATQKKLLITGGSDFHGSIKPDIPLGASIVGIELFEQLI